jgi:hypothetical protein
MKNLRSSGDDGCYLQNVILHCLEEVCLGGMYCRHLRVPGKQQAIARGKVLAFLLCRILPDFMV